MSSATNLHPGHTSANAGIYVASLSTGVIELISVAMAGQANATSSSAPGISADGRYVVFASEASNLVPGDSNGHSDVFLRDRVAGTTTLVSVHSDGTQGDGDPGREGLDVSADGRYVIFGSTASNLVDGDSNNVSDVFLRDLVLGETTRVSVGPNGEQGDGHSTAPQMNADASRVVFSSNAGSLAVDGDANWDVFTLLR